ncbi:uncharacterized protein LOC109821898 [Asparagus officinalis]|uniref:uncharacterized protein LOC109821898 n=1 Tax=Asparagus officinalis TaxID=4686 RepID=UPI00098E83CB|nr:uncharacterized protein LOC109821898 [Asparagus officinalis]
MGPQLTPSLARGVLKKGDSLPPMLFLLVVDVLCKMLHNSCDHGDLSELHLKGMLNDIKSLQFADDTIVFCKANPTDITNLKSILYLFECTSGLSINFSKSNLFYSGKSSTKGPLLANILNCSFASPPFKYLDLPLKRGSLSRADWQPLIDSLYRKLSIWKSKQLSIGGRLVLFKSVLSSIPIYYMSFFKLSCWLIKKIDRIRCDFLWGGTNTNIKTIHPVRWDAVCSPKACGGLGVSNLHLFNISLLSKWLWNFLVNSNYVGKVLQSIYHSNLHNPSPAYHSSKFWKDVTSCYHFFTGSVKWALGASSSKKAIKLKKFISSSGLPDIAESSADSNGFPSPQV